MLPSKFTISLLHKIQVSAWVFGIAILASSMAPVHAFSSQECDVETGWFSENVPKPKEGPNSPFAYVNDKDQSTNCDFHQWSWNKFLYLTQSIKATGKLVMFGPGFWQVDNALKPYFEPWVDLLKPIDLMPSKHLILEDFNQAGFGKPIIYSKYSGLPVHFSIHVNDTFIKSVNSNLTADPNLEFSVGSTELKVAWIDVKDLQEVYKGVDLSKQFYIRTAIYKSDNKYSDPTEVAMIGMHVVGVVENHPEFIWATFEHTLNAPDYYVSGDKFKKSNAYLAQDKIVSSKDDYLLYRSNTKVKNAHLNYSTHEQFTNSFRLYQYGVPNGLPYTNNADNKFGASLEQQQRDEINFNNIAHLNNAVKKKLSQSNSVWSNYFYAGSVWLNTTDYNFSGGISGDIVGNKANKSLRGSLAAANMTMETYTQTFSSINGSQPQIKAENCFACHGTKEGESTMQVSHIYKNYLKWIKLAK